MMLCFSHLLCDVSSLSLCLFTASPPPEIYTLSLHDALPISSRAGSDGCSGTSRHSFRTIATSRRSEEHTSELQSLRHLVCRLLLEKKKIATKIYAIY